MSGGVRAGRQYIDVGVVVGFAMMTGVAQAETSAMTAGKILEELGGEERFSYVAGVIEGLAYSRYVNDGKATEGMRCVYDWFYGSTTTIDRVYVAFNRFKDYPPGAVIAVLVNRECGG